MVCSRTLKIDSQNVIMSKRDGVRFLPVHTQTDHVIAKLSERHGGFAVPDGTEEEPLPTLGPGCSALHDKFVDFAGRTWLSGSSILAW